MGNVSRTGGDHELNGDVVVAAVQLGGAGYGTRLQ
jgi:hypothetical protein